MGYGNPKGKSVKSKVPNVPSAPRSSPSGGGSSSTPPSSATEEKKVAVVALAKKAGGGYTAVNVGKELTQEQKQEVSRLVSAGGRQTVEIKQSPTTGEKSLIFKSEEGKPPVLEKPGLVETARSPGQSMIVRAREMTNQERAALAIQRSQEKEAKKAMGGSPVFMTGLVQKVPEKKEAARPEVYDSSKFSERMKNVGRVYKELALTPLGFLGLKDNLASISVNIRPESARYIRGETDKERLASEIKSGRIRLSFGETQESKLKGLKEWGGVPVGTLYGDTAQYRYELKKDAKELVKSPALYALKLAGYASLLQSGAAYFGKGVLGAAKLGTDAAVKELARSGGKWGIKHVGGQIGLTALRRIPQEVAVWDISSKNVELALRGLQKRESLSVKQQEDAMRVLKFGQQQTDIIQARKPFYTRAAYELIPFVGYDKKYMLRAMEAQATMLGYSGKEKEMIVRRAQQEYAARGGGEVGALLVTSAATERMGRIAVAERFAALQSQGFKFAPQGSKAVFGISRPFLQKASVIGEQIGYLGMVEGFTQEVGQTQSRQREMSAKNIAFMTGAGGLSAFVLGGAIGGLAPTPSITGKIAKVPVWKLTKQKTVSFAANLLDWYEKPGDILEDWIEAGEKRFLRVQSPAAGFGYVKVPTETFTGLAAIPVGRGRSTLPAGGYAPGVPLPVSIPPVEVSSGGKGGGESARAVTPPVSVKTQELFINPFVPVPTEQRTVPVVPPITISTDIPVEQPTETPAEIITQTETNTQTMIDTLVNVPVTTPQLRSAGLPFFPFMGSLSSGAGGGKGGGRKPIFVREDVYARDLLNNMLYGDAFYVPGKKKGKSGGKKGKKKAKKAAVKQKVLGGVRIDVEDLIGFKLPGGRK